MARPPQVMFGVLPSDEMIGQVPVTAVTPLKVEVLMNASPPVVLDHPRTCPPVPVPNMVEVAMNCGMAVPLVLLARMELGTAVVPNAVVIAVVPEPVVTPEMVMDWLEVRQPVQLPALPVMLIDIGVEVDMEAKVLAPVA